MILKWDLAVNKVENHLLVDCQRIEVTSEQLLNQKLLSSLLHLLLLAYLDVVLECFSFPLPFLLSPYFLFFYLN